MHIEAKIKLLLDASVQTIHCHTYFRVSTWYQECTVPAGPTPHHSRSRIPPEMCFGLWRRGGAYYLTATSWVLWSRALELGYLWVFAFLLLAASTTPFRTLIALPKSATANPIVIRQFVNRPEGSQCDFIVVNEFHGSVFHLVCCHRIYTHK